MQYLNTLDYSVIAIYSAVLLGIALYLRKKASASLEDYFLGGRKLPWWALGISGMTNFLDMAGTMIIVSFLYMLGPRGLYIEFRGGAVLVLAFMMLWTGKWHWRSRCMTGAEWNIYRFGANDMARAARLITAVAFIVFTIGMLAYLIQGARLFLPMFLNLSPLTCAIIMVGLTTLYTLLSGFYGVVYVDLFQAGIIILTVAIICVMAISATTGYDGNLGELAAGITGSHDWLSSAPHWETSMPRGYEAYQALGMFMLFYLFRNILAGLGTGADPRYFGARNERECGLLTFFWTWLMTIRWPMMMGFAVLGLFLVRDLFPDQGPLREAEISIKRYVMAQAGHPGELDFTHQDAVLSVIPRRDWVDAPDLIRGRPEMASQLQLSVLGDDWQATYQRLVDQEKTIRRLVPRSQWESVTGSLVRYPERHEPLVRELQAHLGEDWREKLQLVSYEGTVNPERILPAVVLMRVPEGIRGLFLVALVAAAMSTFSPQVNAATAFFTRDMYQAFLRPAASNGELIAASYGFGLLLVLGAFGMAYTTESINDIWGWIIMGLGAGLAMPGLLRLYWWRFNAGGVVVGTAVGLVGAILQRLAFPELDERLQFLILLSIGVTGAVLGTYLTRPTDPDVLDHFYKTTRPFGFWGPLRKRLAPDVRAAMDKENRRDILAVPFALGWQVTLFLLPMQLVIGTYYTFGITLVIFLVCLAAVYLLWYRHLPSGADGLYEATALVNANPDAAMAPRPDEDRVLAVSAASDRS